MYGAIVFYTHGSTVEYGGELFPAGELTADILNFAPEDYRPIQRILDRMKDLAQQYEDTLDRGVWWELNNQLIELRSKLMRKAGHNIRRCIVCKKYFLVRSGVHALYCEGRC